LPRRWSFRDKSHQRSLIRLKKEKKCITQNQNDIFLVLNDKNTAYVEMNLKKIEEEGVFLFYFSSTASISSKILGPTPC
jgi:hypothetical protein